MAVGAVVESKAGTGSNVVTGVVTVVVATLLLGMITSMQGHADEADLQRVERETKAAIEKVSDESKDRKDDMQEQLNTHLETARKEQIQQALFRGAVMAKLGIVNPGKQ